jgi:hypothetical protein
MRISMAGLSTTRMFAVLSAGRMPAFDSPDPTQVNTTTDRHPPYQCRLDTYFHGGLCTVDYNEEIGQNNPNIGTCNRPNGEETGSRRLCWYKPSGDNTNPTPTPNPPTPPTDNISPAPTVNGQSSLVSSNPNQLIPLAINLSKIPGAASIVLEASKPNTTFSNPNGTSADPVNSLGYDIIRGAPSYNLSPATQLPGWGSYEFRVLALNINGRVFSRFSDAFTLVLRR